MSLDVLAELRAHDLSTAGADENDYPCDRCRERAAPGWFDYWWLCEQCRDEMETRLRKETGCRSRKR